jgi:hypothetical protein
MVLADDPGCSVLTVTSLGLMRLSSEPGKRETREIALWKQSGGSATELWLGTGSHALLLALSCHKEQNSTIDGRSDQGATVRVELTSVHSVTHPHPLPPWID